MNAKLAVEQQFERHNRHEGNFQFISNVIHSYTLHVHSDGVGGEVRKTHHPVKREELRYDFVPIMLL